MNKFNKIISEILEADNYTLDSVTDSYITKLKKKYFNNYHSSSSSMQLTKTGFLALCRIKKEVRIKIPKTIKIVSNHILYLDRYLKTPYYLITYQQDGIWFNKKYPGSLVGFSSESYISLFDSGDAFELLMLDGDIDAYVRIKKEGENANFF